MSSVHSHRKTQSQDKYKGVAREQQLLKNVTLVTIEKKPLFLKTEESEY